MSSFSGLNTGLTSLYAQRRGLELAGHNIANVNTEGYSRQRLNLQGNDGPLVGAVHSRWNGTGSGVMVAGVDRLRDVFLESRGVQERGTQSALEGDRMLLGRVEAILAEPGTSGIQSQLADVWAGWDDVANQPDSRAARGQLLERSKTLAAGLNGAVDLLTTQWNASREQLSASVQDLNATAAAVADYNRSIVQATQSGLSPNDLTDQRDALVQRLGELAGVSIRSGDHGSVDVFLNGTALVRGTSAERLKVQGATQLTLPAGEVVVAWERNEDPSAPGYRATVGGSLGSLQSGLNELIPRYRNDVVSISAAVATAVNDIHRQGFDPSGAPGQDVFAVVGGRLEVLLDEPGQVAASATRQTDPVTGLPTGGGDRGGAVAARIAELATKKDGPDDKYRQVIVGLGVEAQTANRRVDIQADILAQVDAARESEAGVNLDEEMTSMLAYQRAYEGAARFISAVDQMLDTLINRTGVVGR